MDWRKCKIFFYIGGHRNNLNTCSCCKTIIIGIEWFGCYNFFTRVYARHKSKQYSFGSTCCNKDLGMIDIYTDLPIICCKLKAIRFITRRMAVLNHFQVNISEGIKRYFRSMNIGLPDIKMVHNSSFTFSFFRIGNKSSYW